MPLDTSVNDTGKGRVLSKETKVERVVVSTLATSYSWKRTRTIITKEWVALTFAAVNTYIDTHAGDTDVINGKIVNRMDIQDSITGAYKMIQDIDSKTAFTLET